ncbi:MAG: Sec-independent protein translocase protein TatC [Nitrospirales bacterium]|nr:MAG: Sec-independent protein translocase protein TatC [Nitrospirales bacterium]
MAKQSKLGSWFEEKVFKPLEDKKMPVMEHLQEFQWRLTRAVIVMACVFVGTFFYADTLVSWLRIPLQNYFILDSWEWMPSDLPKIPFVFLSPAEALWQNVKVAGLCALVLSTPHWLWEVWQFVLPGLHAQERRFVGPFTAISTVAFYLGLTFCFFVVLPFALHFLISYGLASGFIAQISIANYVGFILWFLLVFGLIFEVPLALTLMAKLGWVDAPILRKYRKWAFLGSFLFAAILTPTPDPFNQCIMAIPMYFFYEVGIISAQVFGKKKSPESEDATAPTPASGQPVVRRPPLAPQPVGAGSSGDEEYVDVPDSGPR